MKNVENKELPKCDTGHKVTKCCWKSSTKRFVQHRQTATNHPFVKDKQNAASVSTINKSTINLGMSAFNKCTISVQSLSPSQTFIGLNLHGPDC